MIVCGSVLYAFNLGEVGNLAGNVAGTGMDIAKSTPYGQAFGAANKILGDPINTDEIQKNVVGAVSSAPQTALPNAQPTVQPQPISTNTVPVSSSNPVM